MRKRQYIEQEIEHNDRVFILMLGYGKANLFRDLNERRERLVNRLHNIYCSKCGKPTEVGKEEGGRD